MIKQNISKDAIVKNSKFESDYINIKSGAKLTDVFIKAKKIDIDSDVILTNCKIISNNSVIIKKNSEVKENSVINAFNGIFIGERVIIDRDVVIGGMQSEKSKFFIDDDSVILFRSYINTTRGIRIGKNVGIGGYCLIFTHSSWQNVLEGNHYTFADVRIDDNVWIPWNVTVFPGVSIGKNSTIGGGSVITKNIPPSVFAAGVPAKIIKKKINKIDLREKNKIIKEIMTDFSSYASKFLELHNSFKIEKNNIFLKFDRNRIIFTDSFSDLKSNDIICSFKIPIKFKQKFQWVEFDSKSSNIDSDIGKKLLLFLKRYGIRIN